MTVYSEPRVSIMEFLPRDVGGEPRYVLNRTCLVDGERMPIIGELNYVTEKAMDYLLRYSN